MSGSHNRSGVPPEAANLPVTQVLPALCASLEHNSNAVLCAPPGAGKTTAVPLALLHSAWMRGTGRLLMLEPRRLAARAAARRMASLLGEACGQTVGFRMRMESCVSARTRIEVITEGVLTRMLQDDAALEGICGIIFDEFHTRSLQADTGLALSLEVQAALRPDLRLLVMSATLDVDAVATLLGHCPVHTSEGRIWPVDIRHLPPRTVRVRTEDHVAAVVRHMLRQEAGSVLVFLPGTAEIRRVAALLGESPAEHTSVYPLYGDLPSAQQDAALLPCPASRRKVVLATSIAETSLTIEGVRVVVDAGLARSAVFDPATGMGRLVTMRVSQAAARQRAGRAGRMEPGIACRLWHKEEEAGFRPFDRPEILDADLTPLLLQLALWGTGDPAALHWLDSPPENAAAYARQVLCELGAVDAQGRITAHGRQLAALPLHPRLGHMVLHAAAHGSLPLSCCLAALLGERPPQRAGSDVRGMLAALLPQEKGWPLAERLRRQALHMARIVQTDPLKRGSNDDAAFFRQARAQSEECGALLAVAWPQWVAQNMSPGQFRLRNGRMATLPEDDALARESFLAVAALDGQATRARIFAAAPLTRAELELLFGPEMQRKDCVDWDMRTEAVLARRRLLLDALVLEDMPLAQPDPVACVAAAVRGIAATGLHCLPWTEELRQWQARVRCMRELEGETWPDVSDGALQATLEAWLAPFLTDILRREHLKRVDLDAALRALLPWNLHARLDREAPTHVEVPSGSRLRVDYTAEGGPVLAVKLQEMFGCAHTPCIAEGRLPLTLHLNSPAGRPLQVTRDLAGFWAGSYAAVRAEMRGRYPKHPWPEDPATAAPTRHTKARAKAHAALMAAKPGAR